MDDRLCVSVAECLEILGELRENEKLFKRALVKLRKEREDRERENQEAILRTIPQLARMVDT